MQRQQERDKQTHDDDLPDVFRREEEKTLVGAVKQLREACTDLKDAVLIAIFEPLTRRVKDLWWFR